MVIHIGAGKPLAYTGKLLPYAGKSLSQGKIFMQLFVGVAFQQRITILLVFKFQLMIACLVFRFRKIWIRVYK